MHVDEHALGDAVIPLETWEALAEPDAPKPASLILAADVAPRSKSASIAAAGVHDGNIIVSVLESGEGCDGVVRGEDLRDELGAEVVVDGKAVASILPEIDHLDPTLVDGTGMADACALFLDLAEPGKLRHRAERELTVALDAAAVRPLGDQWAFSRKRSGAGHHTAGCCLPGCLGLALGRELEGTGMKPGRDYAYRQARRFLRALKVCHICGGPLDWSAPPRSRPSRPLTTFCRSLLPGIWTR